MTLSTLAIVLGLLVALPSLFGVIKPAAAGAGLRRFPRHLGWGYALMGLATVWFLYNVSQETISDFAAYKNLMLFGFGAIGILTCIFVKDFLAVRGLAVVLLLLAKVMVDTARWHDSSWRLIISAWAYVWILAGIWFTISPWRMRDLIQWGTANEQRIRLASFIPFAFGLFIVLLGLTAFRAD